MTEQASTEEKTGTLDESQLKDEDSILQDTPVKYEDIPPLFGEEGVEGTDEPEPGEKGEEKPPESEKEAATAPPEGEKPPEEAKPKEEAKVEEKPPEEEKKPPPGYVEIAALKEARGQLKELRESHEREIHSLRQELAAERAAKAKEAVVPDQWKDFKVLSKQEFQDLADTNPVEAIKYQQELIDYNKYQDSLREAEEQEARQADNDKVTIQNTIDQMKAEIPGLYEEESEIRDKLTDFAISHGASKATLGILTDPATLVLPPGADEPMLLGPRAAELVRLIHKTYGLAGKSDRAKIEKEVEAKLRPEIEKELLKKFKSRSLGDEFKDIGELPSGSEISEDIFDKTDFTEEQWGRLPESKRRALLGG